MDENSFDYILCDVPCSGDGTVRKSPKILGKWSPKNAARNKPLQKELLKVGLGLLKPSESDDDNGGMLVYSTCSLSPMENEEVVSEVMNELNAEEGSGFRFELVDLSEKSSANNTGGNESSVGSGLQNNNQVLRVHPAKSHGGFFVAGIRKIIVAGHEIPSADAACTNKGDVAIDSNNDDMVVRRHTKRADDATISYSISPCTRTCCNDIIEKMGIATIVSSGIAVMYQSNDQGIQILQQGCASLVSPTIEKDGVGFIQLTREELLLCHANCAIHRDLSLPMDRVVRNLKSLNSEMPLVIGVTASASDEGSPSFLLPARIVQVPKENAEVGTCGSAVIKIIARPQIFRRALATQKIK